MVKIKIIRADGVEMPRLANYPVDRPKGEAIKEVKDE